VGQFVVPKYGHGVDNETFDARYIRSFKESLPEEHVGYQRGITLSRLMKSQQWLPMEYYGSEEEGGVNDHFYHVFNTVRFSSAEMLTDISDMTRQPLYYKIPEGAVL
jgi:hypothetical protein